MNTDEQVENNHLGELGYSQPRVTPLSTRRVKIICTLGPATESEEVLSALVAGGMDIARLNFSHGTHEMHRTMAEKLRKVAKFHGRHVGILADISGPKLRVGVLDEPVVLVEGEIVELREVGEPQRSKVSIPISAMGSLSQLKPGETVSFADGMLIVRVQKILGDTVEAKVEVGGKLTSHKGVNFPTAKLALPTLTEKDLLDIEFCLDLGVDFFAISFVRRVEDVLHVRDLISKSTARFLPRIISKIERPEALEDIEPIVRASDGIMVARGDLGVEIPPEQVPIEQKRIIHLCNRIGRPVVTATQMLESMVTSTMPTRAEATDVANAIFDGTDAVMLSAETAAGAHPIEALKYMARISSRAEQELQNQELTLLNRPEPSRETVADGIGFCAEQLTRYLPIKAIIAVTESGHSARAISKFRPSVPVIGATPNEVAARSLNLSFGVMPTVVGESGGDTEKVTLAALDHAKELGLVQDGDLCVVVAGIPFGRRGTTNLVKVQRVGDGFLVNPTEQHSTG